MNLWVAVKMLSLITTIVSLSMLWPLAWAVAGGQGDGWALAASIGLGLGISALLFFMGARRESGWRAGVRESFVVVSLSWAAASTVGALPYYIHGMAPTFADAFFEAMSGFTTTGATILADIEAQPSGLLFWRGLTHWIGGMGIIALGMAILPFTGIGGMKLLKAEAPGLDREKMTPRLHQMALRLWGIYLLLTVAATVLLLGGGMSLFDALCHAFSAVATGGFSFKNRSIGYYNSPYIECVLVFFMFTSAVNYTLHYKFLRGDSRPYADDELRFFSRIVIIAVAATTAALYSNGLYTGVLESLRYAAFQVVSVVTSTGFCTADYDAWPPVIHSVFIFLMVAGGCAGSTSGGIKSIRILVLARHIRAGMTSALHPRGVVRVRMGERAVRGDAVALASAFFVLYIAVLVAGALFMAWLGLDFTSAFTSAAAALGNTGPGLGAVGPARSYAAVPQAGKWALSLLMLLGRLELFSVAVLIMPDMWRR